MKKRLLASLMAATVAVTTLTGCGKTDSSKSSEIVTELTGPVSIEMWHYMTGKQSEVLQSIVDDFNANNGKGITVTALSQGAIPDLNKKIIAASQSNTLPAIVNIYPDAATGLINDKKIVNLSSYIKIVEEKSTLRNLIRTANEIIEMGYDPTEDVSDIMEGAEKKIFNIMQNNEKKSYTPIKDVLVDSFTQLEELYNRKQHITGVPSGFIELDYKTAGFHGSDLVLIAARPAMGKSAFALNIATNAAVRSNVPVVLFSLEMSKEQMVNRILCSEAMVDSNKVRTGKLEEDDWTKLAGSIGPLSDAEIYIDDTPGISVTEIRAKCRKLKLEKNIGMVVIDYLQLVQGTNKRNGSREQEISEISRSLKILAKELNIPVIALSQLSRAVEQRPDHRPMLSDLRESGAIEQDADIVMFLYRDDYYNKDSEKKDIAEVIIAKHRGGSLGTVELLWLGSYTKFVNLERRYD